MGTLKKYDPKQVLMTWDGLDLNVGIAPDTFVTLARTERNALLNTGADGRSTMVIVNNRTGTVQITYRQGSTTNSTLSSKNLQDESELGIKNIGMLQVKNFNGDAIFNDPEAFLDGPPDIEYGVGEANITWTWLCPNLKMDPLGASGAAEV